MIDKVLTICAECKKIRINNESNLWLDREADKKLYDRFIEKYNGKLSHGYCPDCGGEELKKLDGI